ncbi:MAG: GNAT family N-acetyltransferase [Propylenella sp.]
MNLRRAEADDLATVVDITERAYAPYTEEFGYPPIPVTEDYAPRIAAGEVWLLEGNGGTPVGLIVLEEAQAGPPPRSGGGVPLEAVEGAGAGRSARVSPLHHASHGPPPPSQTTAEELAARDSGRSLLIFSVAVAPERQGEGLGLKLLEFAEDVARERGCGELALYTNARMMRNIALYRRFGFAETGRRSNPQREGWIIVDMAKPVSSHVSKRRSA